jgi:hypothetical protein
MGAQIKLDDPIANNTPALVTLMCSGVVPNSAAISGVAGYRHVLENVAARHMKLTVKRMTDLCQVGRSIPLLCVCLAIGGGGVVVGDFMMALIMRIVNPSVRINDQHGIQEQLYVGGIAHITEERER